MREMVTVNGLLQFEQYIGPPVSFQTPRHLFPACLDPIVHQIRECVRVSLALEDSGDNRLPAGSTYIADHVGQLDVLLVSAFCMCCTSLPASFTCRSRTRQI